MSKRTRDFLIGAIIVLLLGILAVALPGGSKAVFLGLLFIAVFIVLLGGLILGLSYLNEVVFPRPRKPTHVCNHCMALYQTPEEENCIYCQEEFGLIHPLQLLTAFLAENSTEVLQKRLEELQAKLKTARGRNILFVEHDMKMLKRLMRMKQG